MLLNQKFWSTFGFEIEISDCFNTKLAIRICHDYFIVISITVFYFGYIQPFCLKNGLLCTTACLHCKGVYCLNVQADSSDSKDIGADDDAAD